MRNRLKVCTIQLWWTLLLTIGGISAMADYDQELNDPSLDQGQIYLDPGPDIQDSFSVNNRLLRRNRNPLLHALMKIRQSHGVHGDISMRDAYSPTLELSKRTPTELAANFSGPQKDQKPAQQEAGKKKGRYYIGYPMCYLKLCLFRPKLMFDPDYTEE